MKTEGRQRHTGPTAAFLTAESQVIRTRQRPPDPGVGRGDAALVLVTAPSGRRPVR